MYIADMLSMPDKYVLRDMGARNLDSSPRLGGNTPSSQHGIRHSIAFR